MPKLNITDEQAAAIDKQPECQHPLELARDRVGRLLLDEAIEARLAEKRKSLKRSPKLRGSR